MVRAMGHGPSPVLALCLLCLATAASAHSADLIYVRVNRSEDGSLEERVTLTDNTLARLVPLDGLEELTSEALTVRKAAIDAGLWDAMPLTSREGSCTRKETQATVEVGYLEFTAHFLCPRGDLSQTFRLLSVLPAGYRIILDEDVSAASGQRFAQGHEQTLVLSQPGGREGRQPSPGTAQVARGEEAPAGLSGWMLLGMRHIFTGYDHLCFLLALLLVGGTWRRVFWMVTSFTLAHSLTLGAAALGWVTLDPLRQRLVEVAIALSIITVAAENLLRQEHRHRAWITFAFGLIHGFGFASVLTQYGLGHSVVAALFGFNLGVEAGQACVVVAVFPLVRWVQQRERWGSWVTRLASLAILAAGGFWLVDRALG